MTPRLSRQTSIFGVVFFVSKSLLGIEGQRKIEKFAIFTRNSSEPCSNIDISNVVYSSTSDVSTFDQNWHLLYSTSAEGKIFPMMPISE